MHTTDNALSLFSSETARWFSEKVGTPTPVQQKGWPVIAAGGHVLVSAPTGTGKTLSAFLVCIDRLKREARQGTLAEGLQVLYISPLKALGNDIRENLRKPLSGIDGDDVRADVRNGDTTAAERRRMLRHPPHILITTPESLFLLLTAESGQRMLRTANTVIIDELHAIINSKRGAHLMLSLARLDMLCEKPLQRIGLSATIEPLHSAAEYLIPTDPVTVIAPPMEKKKTIEVNGALEDMRTLKDGTIWPDIARKVFEYSQGARTIIAFVEGRQQAEKLAFYINATAGEGYARTHHGCISKEQRLEAEQQLRSGQLRVLCATSSMELGIDVGEVDLVVQVGFPRTISSAMQRLGRAGHNPGRTSVMRIVPRTAAEGVTCGLTATIALGGGIEQSHPPRLCLDVLSQHLVSMAVTRPYTIGEAQSLLARAYNFQHVSRSDIEDVLGMLAGDYEHEQDRPARPRVLYDRLHGTVRGDQYSRMLALSAGGTIPDRGYYAVRLPDGTRLGELDEEFVFEARIGDKFLLGAFAWRLEEIRHDSVVVSPATPEGAQPPFWKGDWDGRSVQTGRAFGALLRRLTEAQMAGRLLPALKALHLDEWAARNAAHFLGRQFEATGVLPDDRTLLVEHFQDDAGEHQMMVHSVFGGRVNAGLSTLLREAARRQTGIDVTCFDDDDGFLLFPYGGKQPLPDGLLYALSPGQTRAVLEAALPATPIFNMAFRYNAGRALMMGVRNGRRLPLWVQRLRGAQVLDEAVGQASHPLMRETRRECLEDYWDLPAIDDILSDIQAGRIAVRELHLPKPSPMALPLRRAAESVLLYDYFPTPASVHRHVSAQLTSQEMLPPSQEQLEHAAARRRMPEDEEQLHALLMAEGDLIAGEVDVPLAWLESLASNGRALYIEPGLWIAAEQAQLYKQALTDGMHAARLRILRRCLRYRGPQDAQSVSERYIWAPETAQALLTELASDGVTVLDEPLFYHAELYSRAQRETVAQRRRQIETVPAENYAALLCASVRVNASTAEQLRHGIKELCGLGFAPALWESVLLPARCAGYKPQMLDELLAEGAFFWRLSGEEKPLLSFHRSEDVDWTQPPLSVGADLAPEGRIIVDALTQRGASFAHSLSAVLPGASPLDTLMALALAGLVRADSFVPIRQWLSQGQTRRSSHRIRAGARSAAALSGRWELIRPLAVLPIEERLEQALARSVILSRETIQQEAIPWAEALEILRAWEYTGRARRGYFVSGLSGAQFVSADRFQSVTLSLSKPREDVLWLHASDPAQPWGKSLAHMAGRSFVGVPGTAVALIAGVPVALLERQGQTLRVFDTEKLAAALMAFARDYAQGRVFSQQSRIVIKEYPPDAKDALERAGFSRQMLEYELWQRKL